MIQIKPHYRSEGPRQGSCGVFGGVLILSGLLYVTVEYLIAELNLPLSLGRRGGGIGFFYFATLALFFATFEKCCKNLLQTQCYKVLRETSACCTAKCCKLFEQRFYKRNTATLVIYSGK